MAAADHTTPEQPGTDAPAPNAGSAAVDGALIAEVYRLGVEGGPRELPRHRHDLSREQVETNQRARIILATAEAVTEHGYARTTTRDIIERAGVSTKTFYAHYGGKEEAFLAGYTLLDGALLSMADQPISTTAPRTDLRAHVTRGLQAVAAWPLFTRMRLVEGRAAGRVAEERRIAMAMVQIDQFMRAVEVARAHDPRVGTPSRAAVELLFAGMSEMLGRHTLAHGPETLPELAPVFIEAIERILYEDPPAYVDGE
jgi:AcrR family transcriptional regulator